VLEGVPRNRLHDRQQVADAMLQFLRDQVASHIRASRIGERRAQHDIVGFKIDREFGLEIMIPALPLAGLCRRLQFVRHLLVLGTYLSSGWGERHHGVDVRSVTRIAPPA
jgi:hypothetical protein